MEATYADSGHGGAFGRNHIPRLTGRSGEGVSFRGRENRLNGILSTHGSSWTMAAAFSQEAGLPLKVNLDGNMMHTQKGFFPNIETLGDILAAHGYTNVLLQGSDAWFGGAKLFYESHGNAKILDYAFFKRKNIRPDGGETWWGVEDEKVFAMAKQVLPDLAKEHAPFAFTIFTMERMPTGARNMTGALAGFARGTVRTSMPMSSAAATRRWRILSSGWKNRNFILKLSSLFPGIIFPWRRDFSSIWSRGTSAKPLC